MALLALDWLGKRYQAWQAAKTRAAFVRQAQPYLEASNARRRQVGLLPITAVYSSGWRFYEPDLYEPQNRWVRLVGGTAYSYRPYSSFKVVAYNPKRQLLLWELEGITLDAPGLAKQDYDTTLRRRYSYVAPPGQPAWHYTLHSSSNPNSPGQAISPAQADSTLRYWQARGRRDSLAAHQRPATR